MNSTWWSIEFLHSRYMDDGMYGMPAPSYAYDSMPEYRRYYDTYDPYMPRMPSYPDQYYDYPDGRYDVPDYRDYPPMHGNDGKPEVTEPTNLSNH